MTTTTREWSVWLGSEASIWSHRGYTVRGESVLCESREDAESVLRATYGDDLVEEQDHYYATQEDCDADSDGSRALAVIRQEALS